MAGYPYYSNPFLPAYAPPLPTPTVPQYPTPTLYPQAQAQPTQAAQNPGAVSGGILWVTEADAVSYVPSAGQAVALWLRDKPVIYVKSLDTMGKPVTSILDYTERAANAPVSVPASGTGKDTPYALKSELDALRAEFAPVLALVNTPRKKEADNGEQPV